MELGQAEPDGILHHHDGGLGHVHSHLHYGSGDEERNVPPLEAVHDIFLLAVGKAAVEQTGPQGRKTLPELGEPGLRRRQVKGFAFLNEGADPVDPFTGFHPFPEEREETRNFLRRNCPGRNGFSSRGQLVDDGDGKVAVDREGKGAGNGGSRHDQDMGAPAL